MTRIGTTEAFSESTMNNPFSRRELLRKGGMIAVGMAAPGWLTNIARADVLKRSQGKNIIPDGILVVCQLSGGNDGLNTVVPYADPKYYQLRPNLGIAQDQVLRINEHLGFHPAMAGMASLYKEGKVAVVQNVGYPRPNRSHFKSMDIWHVASPEVALANGWIGRHLDILGEDNPLNPVVALGLSNDKPRALMADKMSVPCFASLSDIQSMVGDPDAERMLRQIAAGSGSDAEKVVAAANKSALDAMVALRDQLSKFSPKEAYGDHKFGQGFKQIAQLLATSPQTRVVYFSVGGFDTHAKQTEQHAALLKGFSEGMLAFQREMEAVGKADKIVTMVFSEFGRRSYENASGGTDHGAAAPMFVVGKAVKGGVYGPKPDLENLADGDLKYGVDFRQMYATALDQWMGGDSGKVLAGKFEHVNVLKGV